MFSAGALIEKQAFVKEMENIKVAVRSRPLSNREASLLNINAYNHLSSLICCFDCNLKLTFGTIEAVTINENQVTITNLPTNKDG